MHLKKFTFLLALLTTCSLQAQEEPSKSQLAPCGTAPQIDPWLIKFQANPGDYPENAADTLYAGVQIHLIARDNGTGRFSPEKLLDAFCRLNEDFKDTDIRFYFKNEWNLLDNSDWYQHDSTTQGIQMMFTNNVPDVLNAYFMSYPAGTCGYNLPYAGVAIGHGCAGPNDHTWAHEVGHALGLPHTFIGWEDKVYNPAQPTPDTLTYDYTHYHSTPDTIVPAPLDTALVEYVDGSNCGIAADRVCDTKPDYLSYRWNCDPQGMSTVQQKDPTGATFYSDGSLFMSYANDACQNRFSPDQIQIMRTRLLTVKESWLANEPQGGEIAGLPQLVSPLNNEPAPASGALLQWHPTPGATHYVVQASRISSFAIKEFEVAVSDTFAIINDNLFPNLTYYWRVRPFNNSNTCTAFTANSSFKTVPVSKTQSATAAGWRIYPTLLTGSTNLTMELPENWINNSIEFRIFSTSGSLVWQGQQDSSSQKELLQIPSENWSEGVYYLVCTGKLGVIRQTLVVLGN